MKIIYTQVHSMTSDGLLIKTSISIKLNEQISFGCQCRYQTIWSTTCFINLNFTSNLVTSNPKFADYFSRFEPGLNRTTYFPFDSNLQTGQEVKWKITSDSFGDRAFVAKPHSSVSLILILYGTFLLYS